MRCYYLFAKQREREQLRALTLDRKKEIDWYQSQNETKECSLDLHNFLKLGSKLVQAKFVPLMSLVATNVCFSFAGVAAITGLGMVLGIFFEFSFAGVTGMTFDVEGVRQIL